MTVLPASKLSAARGELDRWGFAVLRKALDADWIAANRAQLRAYVEPHLATMTPESRAIGASASAPTFTLADAPPAVAAFITDSRLGAMAAAMLGAPAVRLLHFCGFFKPPAGPATPWHRDLDFIPLATDRVVTAWLPLVPVDAAMGLLAFVAGSHKDGRRPTHDALSFPQIGTGALAPGDVSFHLGWTLHSAGANRSDRMREAMAVSFYADGARVGEDDGVPFRAALRRQYFTGLQPGDIAASPINPVVFDREAPLMEKIA